MMVKINNKLILNKYNIKNLLVKLKIFREDKKLLILLHFKEIKEVILILLIIK